jgi:2,5-diamino-6-(ribosylamino)-4(3H)-pyrimidinone 5'-phosphate reductase
MATRDDERVDEQLGGILTEYLPRKLEERLPFVTLTYASSLDSRISSGPGVRTAISHVQTKAMTQYLRLHHDGILIGVNTANADDPGLNCKYPVPYSREQSPTPLVVDPHCRWTLTPEAKIVQLARRREGRAPWALVRAGNSYQDGQADVLRSVGGRVVALDDFAWRAVFARLKSLGLDSIMVEGGAHVINSLLQEAALVNSLIVTIGSTYLGQNGVQVSPPAPASLANVKWWTGIRDAVVCATISS